MSKLPLLLLAAAPVHAAPRSSDGPIVVFLVDALRPERLAVYGGPVRAPETRRLAEEGVVFRDAHAHSSWTRPSVATLLTSRLPSEVGALGRRGRLDADAWYLPDRLHRAGWGTMAAVANYNISLPLFGFRRGFDDFAAFASTRPAREVAGAVAGFVGRQASPRFFAYVHVMDTHWPSPYMPFYEPRSTPTWSGGYLRPSQALYDRAAERADEGLGEVRRALEAKGWWDRATVVFLSDHGEEFWDHGRFGHGRTLYEEQVRVPLIVKFPAGRGASGERSDPVTLADVAPTLAELAGLDPPSGALGRSLLQGTFPADREIYMTEDLRDDLRLYALLRGRAKAVARLAPVPGLELLRLDEDPRERQGRSTTAEKNPLGPALRRWRERDLQGYPRIEVERRFSTAADLDFDVPVASGTAPWLTIEDGERYASALAGASLRVRRRLEAGEEFRLSLADFDEASSAPPGARRRDAALLPRSAIRREAQEALKSMGYLDKERSEYLPLPAD